VESLELTIQQTEQGIFLLTVRDGRRVRVYGADRMSEVQLSVLHVFQEEHADNQVDGCPICQAAF
jgi:hypothetical protein